MPTVLVVDDSRTQVTLFKTWLEQSGLHTLVAADGDEAIQMAADKQPDLILMDLVMPRMNGFHATRRLHREPATTRIPVVIVSSKDQETDRVWALRQGAVDYLVKPVSRALLMQRVESILDSRQYRAGTSAPRA